MNTQTRPPIGVQERLLTVDDFLALSEAGAFDDAGKVELIDGRLVMAPMGGIRHTFGQSGASLALTRIVLASPDFERTLRIISTPTIRVSEPRALKPDTAVAPLAALRGDQLLTPADLLLAVETADTSERYDDGDKKELYAEAGVAELWIVRMAKRDVRVCREPASDGTWGFDRLYAEGEVVSPLFAPEAEVAVKALLGEA